MTTDKTRESAMPDSDANKLQRDGDRAAKAVEGDLKAAADEIKKDAGRAVEAVKDEVKAAGHQAEGMAQEQKDAVAGHLDGIAGAIRHAADDLEGQSSPGARVTREAADRLGQLSRALRENSVGDLVGMAEDFGRRQPAAFLGASALAGFVASRFLVASGHRRRPAPSSEAGMSGQTAAGSYGSGEAPGQPGAAGPASATGGAPLSRQQGGSL